jgi:DNA-binding phage protein
MKREFRDYQEKLIQDLQDPEEASLYLNEALKDEDPRVFLLALKNVCEAQGIKDNFLINFRFRYRVCFF